MRRQTIPGFSLFELVLVLGIMAMLIGLTAVVQNQALRMQQVDQTAELLRAELVSARTEAIANSHDGRWGIKIFDGAFVQFHGDGYDVRDATLDKRFEFPSDVTVSGTREYVFKRNSGFPSAAGETDFSDQLHSLKVIVNRYGAISIE